MTWTKEEKNKLFDLMSSIEESLNTCASSIKTSSTDHNKKHSTIKSLEATVSEMSETLEEIQKNTKKK